MRGLGQHALEDTGEDIEQAGRALRGNAVAHGDVLGQAAADQDRHGVVGGEEIPQRGQRGDAELARAPAGVAAREAGDGVGQRSEANTSELQSLMRISYAVFCFKKKNTQTRHKYTTE